MQQSSTSLGAQLSQLKQQARAVRLEPNQAPPSLLFSETTARSVDIDLIHSMAVSGYARLRDYLCGPADLHSELLSHEMKGLNRNHLTKSDNEQLSTKLRRMLLWLSPLFLEADCQKILDYLLRNFHVHVFEGESLCLLYLQFYREPIYAKLISNVNLEGRHLSWLKVFLRKDQAVNQELLVKAFALDNYLLEQLRKSTLELIKDQARHQEENTVIRLQEDQQQPVNPLTFVYTIYLSLLARSPTKYIPTVAQFCLEVLRFDHEQAVNMAIMLFVQMMLHHDMGASVVMAMVRVLLGKVVRMQHRPTTVSNIGEFVLVVWQRFSEYFDRPLVEAVLATPIKDKLLVDRQQSLASIFLSLVKALFEGLVQALPIIKHIALRVKVDKQLLGSHSLEEKFYNHLFQLYDAHVKTDKATARKPKSKKELKSQQNIEVTPSELFEQVLMADFAYEFAQHINKTLSGRTVKEIQRLFSNKKHKVSEDGVDMKGLKRKMPESIEQEINYLSKVKRVAEETQQPQLEEEEQPEQPKPKRASLLSILRSSLPDLKEVVYNEQTRPHLQGLVTEYYATTEPSITADQKNAILEHIGLEHYGLEELKTDLKNRDWAIPILFTETCKEADALLLSACPFVEAPQLLDDLLFRELMRKSIGKLCELSRTNYNIVVAKLSKLAEDLSKAIDLEGRNILIVLDICSFIVKQLLSHHDGQNRGRLFKLALVHVSILTRLLNSDLHEGNVQSIFKGVLDLYGPDNLYVFYVGFAQQISKAQFKPATIDKLKRLLIALFLEEANAQQIQTFVASCVKSVGLVAQLVLDVQSQGKPSQQFRNSKYNRVPKNTLVKLFGLIRPKEKSKLIRNVLFVMRYLFLSKDFAEKFDQALQIMSEKQRDSVVSMFSEVYDTTLSIKSTNPKVTQQVEKLLENITALFPMSLLTKLLVPLLPNTQLYGLLADKLAEHPKCKLRDLEVVLSILPEEVSVQYCRLARVCIQRDCKVETDWVEFMLTCEEPRLTISLIAEASKRQHYTLIPYLQKISEVLLKELDSVDEYLLAVAHTLVSSLGGLLDPYVKELIVKVLKVRSELVKPFFQSLVENVGVGSLLKIALELFGLVQQQSRSGTALEYGQIVNLCYLLMELARKGTGEELVKGMSSFLELISRHILQDESLDVATADQIQRLQADIFQLIVLKLNEHQLKKVINNLVSWSNKEQQVEHHLPFNYRKPVLVRVCIRLLETMGQLFVPFFGYFFEELLADLKEVHAKTCWAVKKSQKRQAELGDREREISLNYTKSVLKLLELLFNADTNEDFVDSVRFDQLVEPLSRLFECTRAFASASDYPAFIEHNLSACLVALCQCVKDDYKLKTLNFNILSRLKAENDDIRLAIFRFIDHLIESIGDRYLIIINDLVPFIAEHIYSNNEPLQKTVKAIVNRLEQLSGEDMREYIQNHSA